MDRDFKVTIRILVMNSESYKKNAPHVQISVEIEVLRFPSAHRSVSVQGEIPARGRATRFVRQKRRSAKLHILGQFRGKISSIRRDNLYTTLYSLLAIKSLLTNVHNNCKPSI